MIVLVDTDVLVDLALERHPYVDDAAALLDMVERGAARGFVAWHTVSNFYYLVSARRGAAATRRFIDELMHFVDIAPTTTVHLRAASALSFKGMRCKSVLRSPAQRSVLRRETRGTFATHRYPR